jgi:peptidoglycan/LPS O-acetylase OafA/YrhL
MGILRTMLALAIVVYHSFTVFGLRMTGGQVAVQSFYIISGFYMALILNEKYFGDGSYWRFIKARLFRIYPLYWLVLILAFCMSFIGYYGFGKAFYFYKYFSTSNVLSPLAYTCFIFENIFVVGQDVMLFLKIDVLGAFQFSKIPLLEPTIGFHYMLVPQAWSISIELCFYFLAPFLVRRHWKWQSALVILLFGIRMYVIYQNSLYYDPWTHRFFPFELPYFLLGSLSYTIYTYFKAKAIDSRIGFSLLFVMIACIIAYNEIFYGNFLKTYIFYAYVFISLPFIFISFKNIKWDRWIGELSFSIYISHHLIVKALHDLFFKNPSYIKYYGYTIILLSLLLAVILNQWFQAPIERWRQKYITKSVKKTLVK